MRVPYCNYGEQVDPSAWMDDDSFFDLVYGDFVSYLVQSNIVDECIYDSIYPIDHF